MSKGSSFQNYLQIYISKNNNNLFENIFGKFDYTILFTSVNFANHLILKKNWLLKIWTFNNLKSFFEKPTFFLRKKFSRDHVSKYFQKKISHPKPNSRMRCSWKHACQFDNQFYKEWSNYRRLFFKPLQYLEIHTMGKKFYMKWSNQELAREPTLLKSIMLLKMPKNYFSP